METISNENKKSVDINQWICDTFGGPIFHSVEQTETVSSTTKRKAPENRTQKMSRRELHSMLRKPKPTKAKKIALECLYCFATMSVKNFTNVLIKRRSNCVFVCTCRKAFSSNQIYNALKRSPQHLTEHYKKVCAWNQTRCSKKK